MLKSSLFNLTKDYRSIYLPSRALVSEVTDPDLKEPKNLKEAIISEKWCKAMQEEFEALQVKNTWYLVPFNKSMNLIGSKWVFKIKMKIVDQLRDINLGN